jgi:thioredoxin-related protein
LKKTALFLALTLAVSSSAVASPWIKSFAQAQKQAKEKNRLIFVDLFADWCGWCHKFEQEVIPSQVFQNATDNMVLLRLNTEDGADGTALARTYGVTSLPTFLLLDGNGTIAGILRGYQPANEFVGSMKTAEQGYDGFKKRTAAEPSIGNDFTRRFELAKEFRARYALPQAETRFKKLVGEKSVPVNIRDESYYELALTQLLEKKWDDTLATVQKFSTVQSKGDAYERARLIVGDVYLQQGKLDRAVAEYRKFKSTFPSSPLNRNIDIVLPQIEQQIGKK